MAKPSCLIKKWNNPPRFTQTLGGDKIQWIETSDGKWPSFGGKTSDEWELILGPKGKATAHGSLLVNVTKETPENG